MLRQVGSQALGDIHPRGNVLSLAQAMGMPDDRDLELDFVGRPELNGEQIVRGANAHWLGNAAVVCVPWLHERFGLPVVGALACGDGMVASDREAMPEIAPLWLRQPQAHWPWPSVRRLTPNAPTSSGGQA